MHYVSSPTEVHDYAMIPESNKLQSSEKEQITVSNDAYIPSVKLQQMEPADSSLHSVAAHLTTDMEDVGYVISVSIRYNYRDIDIIVHTILKIFTNHKSIRYIAVIKPLIFVVLRFCYSLRETII